MKKAVLLLSIITSLLWADRALWDQVAKEYAKGKHYASQLVLSDKVTDKKGKAVDRSRMVIEQSKPGSFIFSSASENGKAVKSKRDIQALIKEITAMKTSDLYSAELTPFTGTVSNIRQANSLDPTATVLSYEQNTSDGEWKGKLYLNKKSGKLVKVKATFQNTPFTEEGVKISSLAVTVTFKEIEGTPHIHTIAYRSSITATEGLFTFKGTSQSTITCNAFKKLQ